MVITKASLRSSLRRTRRICDIPSQVFESIIRGLSSRPTHPDWQQFVQLEDAISSFRTFGTLSRAAGNVFTIVSSNYLFFEGDGNRLRLDEVDWTAEDNCNILRFMAVAWRSISTIAFTQNDLALLSDRGRQTLLDYCPNVTRARFHFCIMETFDDLLMENLPHIQGLENDEMLDMPDIPDEEDVNQIMGEFVGEEDPFDTKLFFTKFMEGRRGRLKLLQLDCRVLYREYIDAIISNGKGIEELIIKPSQLPEDTQAIWLVLGPTLRNLTIDFSANYDDEEILFGHIRTMLANVTSTCRKIRRFTLKAPFDREDFRVQVKELVHILAISYKEQLEFLTLDFYLPLQALRSIFKACPNVHTDISAPILKDATKTLDVLEKASCQLNYYLKEPQEFESEEQKMKLVKKVTSTEFKIAARRCQNMYDIGIDLPGIVIGPLLDAFLSSPKQFLTDMTLRLYNDPANYERDISAIMKVLEKPNSLETFAFQLHCAKPHLFKNFALSSRRLRRVYITFEVPSDFADFNAIHIGIIRDFTNCPKLEVLIIGPLIRSEYEPEGPSAAIRTASRLLRSRGVYVEVNDIPYC